MPIEKIKASPQASQSKANHNSLPSQQTYYKIYWQLMDYYLGKLLAFNFLYGPR